MTIKLLRARYVAGRGYLFRVHLDTTQLTPDGSPDPRWVREWVYGEAPPPGKTVTQYRQMIQDQTVALAQKEALEMVDNQGTSLAAEGSEL